MSTKLLLSRGEAAEVLGVSVRTIDSLIKAGRMLAVRLGRRVLIPVEHLQEFARQQ